MTTSKQLLARRRELERNQAQLMEDGETDKARVLEGQIKELDITLDSIVEEEDRIRQAGTRNDLAARPFAEQILGARDEFAGLEIGVKNEGEAPTVVTVGSPTEIELTIPGKSPALLNNFASTLPSAPASGPISFKRRAAQTGSPDTWEGVVDGSSTAKARVLYAWVDSVANKETIAGYVPISKDTLKDYDELYSIIESDLLIDLNEKENSKCLIGNNSTGIVGVQNTTGIQEYTVHSGGAYYDAIRKMRTLVMKNARRVPTKVCIHPDIKEAIDLYKTNQGLYQFLGDGILWGMEVVEDFDCDGIIVYDHFAAKKRPIHGVTVEANYVNDQFIKNELCILAEKTLALQVVYPDAFIHATKTNLDAA